MIFVLSLCSLLISRGFALCDLGCCYLFVQESILHQQFWRPPAVRLRHDHMAAKKKPNPGASEANASTEAPTSTDNTLVTMNGANSEDHGKDFEVEDLTDGDFEVDLHDLGISAEDI